MGRFVLTALLVFTALQAVMMFWAVGKSQPRSKVSPASYYVPLIMYGLPALGAWYLWTLSTWQYRTVPLLALYALYLYYLTRQLWSLRKPKTGLFTVTRRRAINRSIYIAVELALILTLAFAR